MAFDKGPYGVNRFECHNLASAIENSPTFYMNKWVHNCGTAACIAGHALSAETRKAISSLSAEKARIRVYKEAGEMLGINYEQCEVLFWPETRDLNRQSFVHKVARLLGIIPRYEIENVNAAWAGACLRNLGNTGKVDWVGTKPKKK